MKNTALWMVTALVCGAAAAQQNSGSQTATPPATSTPGSTATPATGMPGSTTARPAATQTTPLPSPSVLCGLAQAPRGSASTNAAAALTGSGQSGTGTTGVATMGTGSAGTGSTGTGTTGTGSAGAGSTGTGTAGTGTAATGSGASGTAGAGTSTGTAGTAGTATGSGSGTGSASGSAGRAAPGSAAPSGTTLSTGTRLNSTDSCFATQAALSDQFEIRSSQLVPIRSGSSKVKAMAQQLIREHTDSSRKLLALAARLNLRLPAGLDAGKQAEVAALQLHQGSGFDRAYLAAQVTAHEQAVNLFTAYSKSGTQPQLKQHATSSLPLLQKHLKEARDLFKSIAQ